VVVGRVKVPVRPGGEEHHRCVDAQELICWDQRRIDGVIKKPLPETEPVVPRWWSRLWHVGYCRQMREGPQWCQRQWKLDTRTRQSPSRRVIGRERRRYAQPNPIPQQAAGVFRVDTLLERECPASAT